MERAILAQFPDEVQHVWSRIGFAEIATDPMGIELTDMFITLKPRNQWQKAHTQAELTQLIETHLRDLPGQRLEFLQPIEMRMNEMVSGVRSDLAVKLYGDDLDILAAKGKEIEAILNQIPGSADVASEQITGQPVLQIKLNQQQLARYGVPAKVITDIIESIGSKPLGEVIEGQLRFPLVVRLPDSMRSGVKGIGSIMVPTASGERLPLSTLADIQVLEGPSTITREWGQRRITVSANIRGRDIGSFVAEADRQMKEKFTLPSGRYFYEFGGQFEHLERRENSFADCRSRFALAHFRFALHHVSKLGRCLARFLCCPFRLGRRHFRTLDSRDAVFRFRRHWLHCPFRRRGARRYDFSQLHPPASARGISLEQAVEDAATTRLRPVLMTTLVASLGFLPMAFSTGMGAEVQRPLATVVIGGVIRRDDYVAVGFTCFVFTV